jgi:hypothetical protein
VIQVLFDLVGKVYKDLPPVHEFRQQRSVLHTHVTTSKYAFYF